MPTSNRLAIFNPFMSRLQIISQELRNDLRNLSRKDSLAINWRTLEELHTDVEAQDKVMDEAVEIVYGLEKYADENEHLRDEIERHLSDILDMVLPDPKATPSDSSASSSQNSDETSPPTGACGSSEGAGSSAPIAQGSGAPLAVSEEETHTSSTSTAPANNSGSGDRVIE